MFARWALVPYLIWTPLQAARLERERERAREDVSKVSQLVREANALAEELEVPIRYTLKMRLSLHALCNPSTESAASRQIAITASDQVWSYDQGVYQLAETDCLAACRRRRGRQGSFSLTLSCRN